MGSLVRRYALSMGAAAALLAGCGEAQPPIGAPGATPQSPAIATHAERGGSWMLPEAKHEKLLYVVGSDRSYSVVYVLSYPAGKHVGNIVHAISGLCTDARGDIFMTQSWYSASRILEYAHGGAKPIAELRDPYTGVAGCAVDPTTGNLAVENSQDGTTLVYAHARGKPKSYHNFLLAAKYAGFDDKGNLYTFGVQYYVGLAELAKGAKSFVMIHITKNIGLPIGVQWDGKYLALGDGIPYYYTNAIVYQFTVKGRKTSNEGETQLTNSASAFFIHGQTVAASNSDEVDVYDYPGGGSPISTIRNIFSAESLVVSDAP